MPDAKTPTATPNPLEKKTPTKILTAGEGAPQSRRSSTVKKGAPLPELIIVADDFGVSEQRNLGILHAMEAGVITLASVMVNGGGRRAYSSRASAASSAASGSTST